MAMRARFRVYAPNGALTGSLPFPASWELGVPLNDMPSLSVDYHPDSPGIALLSDPSEVAVEFRDPSTGDYTEYPGCRFMNLRNRGDRLDRAGLTQFTMPSYGWQLRKIRNINFAVFDDDGRRSFSAATPGEIIAALINEAKTRGNVPQLAIDFDGTEDSDGQAWDNTLTISIDAGQDVWSLLDAFTRQGLCDWRMNGRTLQIYNPDTFLNRDLTTDPAIVLRPYFDTMGEPNEATLEELARKALVQGDDNTFVLVENPTALTPWGEWEEFLSQSGVKDEGTMTVLAQKTLEGKAAERVQLTRRLVFRDGSPLPFVNYRPGDHILSTDEDGTQRTDLRVTQLTVSTLESEDIQAFVLLNDRFMERDLRNQRALNSLTGLGGPGAGGGSGGTPTPPPTDDTRQPAAPTGLVVQSTTYIDSTGTPVGQATATWTAVTESTGGSAMDIDRYEVQSRIQSLPEGFETKTFVTAPQTTAFVSPLDTETSYIFRVRAVGENGRSGPFSAEQVVFIARDSTPTPAPSVPILSSRLGTIRVTWDGLDETAAPMPVDFSHIQVEQADNGAGPWTEIGRIFLGGDSVIATDLDYTTEYFYRLISVDTSQNLSDVSAVASIEVSKIEGPDIEANSITANEIAAGTITAEEIAAYSIRADRLAVGQARNLIADQAFADAELSARRVEIAQDPPNSGSTITWAHTGSSFSAQLNDLTFPNNFGRLGYVNNLLVDPNLASGSTLPGINFASHVDEAFGNFVGRFQVRITLLSGTWTPGATVDVSMLTRFYDRDGNNISATTAVGTVSYTDATAGYVTQQSSSGAVPPDGAVAVIAYSSVIFRDHADTNVLVEIAAPFLAQANQGVLIENGSITTPKLVSNAVTTDILAANAITVKHTLTGAFIQTNVIGAGTRVTMGPSETQFNQSGITIWRQNSSSGFQSSYLIMSDNVGTGNWPANSLIIAGPEPSADGTDRRRASLTMQPGGGFWFQKEFVDNDTRLASIRSETGSNELLLNGTLPRGTELNDNYGVFRAVSSTFQNGSITWATDNGWAYRPIIGPRNSGAPASARTSSAYGVSSSGFSWLTSAAIVRVEILTYRGGFLL